MIHEQNSHLLSEIITTTLKQKILSFLIHYEFISESKTVNKQLYIDILCHLRDAVRRKCSDKWRTNSWFLLYDNAPAYWLVVMNDFIAKNNVTTLEHLSYSPDLAAADFYLFSQLKSALMG
jgi:hypothetical protein